MNKLFFSTLTILMLSTLSLMAQNNGQDTGFMKQDTTISEDMAESPVFGLRISKMYKAMLQGFADSKLAYLEETDAIKRLAKLTKSYYDALLEVGFTEEQAIEIVVESDLFALPEVNKGN